MNRVVARKLKCVTRNVQRAPHNPHRTPHNPQRTAYTAHRTTHNPQPTTHNVQRTTYNAHRTPHNVQPTTHNVQRTTYNLQRTTHNPQPTTYNVQPTTHNLHRTTLLLLLALLLFPGCIHYRDLVNFNEGPEFPQSGKEIVADYRLRVQPDDIIYIGVHTVPPELSVPYNLVSNRAGGNSNNNALLGYLVAPDGSIDMVGIGRLEVGGMTLEDIKAVVVDSLSRYLKEPVVDVRFLNFRVTVLGEVSSPGTYTFPQQRVTIMEALGMAGDITQFGSRDSILVVRETNGQRDYGYINLHDRAVFESPYFYLKQNDLIYVEPSKAKLTVVADPARRISPWLGIVSSLTLLVLTLANL